MNATEKCGAKDMNRYCICLACTDRKSYDVGVARVEYEAWTFTGFLLQRNSICSSYFARLPMER